VEDENDNAPVFEEKQYEGHIAENSEGGSEVALNKLIFARDGDSGYNAQFKYTLYGEGSELFAVNQSAGSVTLRKGFNGVLDREEKPQYNLRIVARDKGKIIFSVPTVAHCHSWSSGHHTLLEKPLFPSKWLLLYSLIFQYLLIVGHA